MDRKNYAALDIMKFISALLVIAIHCAPFIEVNASFNFAYVQILARFAVPFFFITSGFLFFQKIDPTQGVKGEANLASLKHYWLRILRIYMVWSVLYLPLVFLSWFQGGFDGSTLLRFVRDVVFNGTYYHLWFLPALLLAIPLVYVLYTTTKKRILLAVSVVLYLIGMLVNVYGEALLTTPIFSNVVYGIQAIFTTSRNGLFFGPIFITLGIYVQDFLDKDYRKPAMIAFLMSALLFCGEAYLLRYMELMHDLTSMYLMVVPCVFFLMIYLVQLQLKERSIYKWLRTMSLLLYVSHIYIIFIFLHVLHLPNIVVYILTCVLSSVFAYVVMQLHKRFPLLKLLY